MINKPFTRRVFGSELKPHDTIVVWWSPRRDMITRLTPYNGPLSYLFSKGAQCASFANNRGGMTIDNNELFDVIVPEHELKIVRKVRRRASPPEGMKQEWIEWQIVQVRTVVSRHDTEAQAFATKTNLLAKKS